MTKIKNYHLHGDETTLNRLEEEYNTIGYDTDRAPGELIVLALPRNSLRKQRAEAKLASKRQPEEDED